MQPMSSLISQTLGPYQLLETMGSGGMATVYKAYHARLDRYVAIKVIHQLYLQDQTFLARFEREAQIVAKLEHPHIVPVYDFADVNGRPYLVMKYIDGSTLKGLLDARKITLNDILAVMPPVASALDYAHQQGILHRDIKPSNILIDTNGTPFLTDFGLARIAQLGESTLSQDVLLGTPNYISPEQAIGRKDLDARTDLYSLGVILYELVVGQVPFGGDTPFSIIHDHIYRPLPKPSDINPELPPQIDDVLIRALAKNPDERYPTAGEMIAAFRDAVQTAGLGALNPERVSVASESLAKLRGEDFQPVPVVKPEERAPRVERRMPPPPPTPPSHSAVIPAPGGTNDPKRKIEASIDLGSIDWNNIGSAIESTIERWGDSHSGNRSETDILMEPDDEVALRQRIERDFKKRREFFAHLVVYVLVNALLWVIFAGANSDAFANLVNDPGVMEFMPFPWPLVVMLGWGAGLLANLNEVYFDTGARVRRRTQIVEDTLTREYGVNWRTTLDKKTVKQVRKRVEAPFNKRKEFYSHLAVYVMINAMLWMIYFVSSGMPGDIGEIASEVPFPWPALVSFGWGIGLVINMFEALTAGSTQRAVEREVARERERRALEKPKNDALNDTYADRNIRLTADGEFTDSMVQEIDAAAKRKRR